MSYLVLTEMYAYEDLCGHILISASQVVAGNVSFITV